MMNRISLLSILVVSSVLFGCRRDDPKCENANISGTVKHHEKAIPSAMVYIKYGSKNAPADIRNPKSYDDSTKAGNDGVYNFTGKKQGNYYIFSIGWDVHYVANVYGGVPLTIECAPQTKTVTANVAVDE